MSASRAISLRLIVLASILLTIAIAVSASRVVRAAEEGNVVVTNTPNVRVTEISDRALRDLRRATPSFLRAHKRYAFIWNPGEPAHVFVIVEVKDDGWVGVVVSDSPQPEFVTVADPRDILWVNVTRAFSIQEVY